MKIHPFLVAAASLALPAFLLPGRLHAYGAEGHYAVGSIAEARLAGTPNGAKVKELLDGIPLGFAATIPDRIKSWDGPDGENGPRGYKMPEHPKVEEQLRAFWRANKASGADDEHPSHHWFHYTDVPLAGNEKYADGKAGRSKWDIVHMINYCCRVLSGEEPAQNERAITPTVAVILLAHYVGDLHQPLHVGAEYFDNGKPANPDTDPQAAADEGGNTFTLALVDPPGTDTNAPRRRPKLHGYWDSGAVKLLEDEIEAEIRKKDPTHTGEITPQEFDQYLAKSPEPANWRSPAGLPLKDWAEAWANDILPVAREAHDRLEFTDLRSDPNNGKPLVRGMAVERPGQNPPYANWSVGVVRNELLKGGWRLALMLQTSLAGGKGTPASLATPAPASARPPALSGKPVGLAAPAGSAPAS